PVVAILDTNCDPDEVDYPIPGNDDAIRSAALLTRVVADATADGLMSRAGRSTGAEGMDKPETGVGADEPLAEWEQELMASADTVPGSPGSGSSGNPSERRSAASPAEPMVANNGVSQI